MKKQDIIEAALIERQEYLEELQSLQKDIESQILTIQNEIDNLLQRIFQSS